MWNPGNYRPGLSISVSGRSSVLDDIDLAFSYVNMDDVEDFDVEAGGMWTE